MDEKKMYVVEGIFLGYVQRIMERLYRVDFERLGSDEARTLANGLDAHLGSHVTEFSREDHR